MSEIPPDSRPELVEEIRRRIEASGGIDFSEYMGLCLYHPEYGYYISPRHRIGKEGDFFTSSSVHALFGRLIARQLKQMADLLEEDEFVIAEQGAGEGHLALDILDALAEEEPEFYRRVRYLLIEVSEDHRRRQKQRLEPHLDRTQWCRLSDLSGIRGCFLSNELVDAFPVHLVQRRGGQLQEVYVVNGEHGFAEELRPAQAEVVEHLRRLGVELAEGHRGEVNLEAPRWMKEIARALEKGFVLTIDYGYPAQELYAPYRQSGTLMCYHRHMSNEDPYSRIGNQDITAHIDFTALQQAGERLGLDTLYFDDQNRFLMGLGFAERLMELQARETDEKKARALRLTLKNLILPEGGMGETFKVLIQGRGVDGADLLCARRLKDMFPPNA